MTYFCYSCWTDFHPPLDWRDAPKVEATCESCGDKGMHDVRSVIRVQGKLGLIDMHATKERLLQISREVEGM